MIPGDGPGTCEKQALINLTLKNNTDNMDRLCCTVRSSFMRKSDYEEYYILSFIHIHFLGVEVFLAAAGFFAGAVFFAAGFFAGAVFFAAAGFLAGAAFLAVAGFFAAAGFLPDLVLAVASASWIMAREP